MPPHDPDPTRTSDRPEFAPTAVPPDRETASLASGPVAGTRPGTRGDDTAPQHALTLRSPPPAATLPAVPGYAVEAEIARGGMGVVYRARHGRLNRPTAIKMILGGKHHGPAARARFLLEAEAVAQLDHPHVVGVYEFGTHDDLPFLALEFVGGGTLAGRLEAGGRLPPRAAAGVLAKLTDGVAAAHAKGIVHRDLKPANVLLTDAGEPKIADFGLARIGTASDTASGAVMGTPSYMAPEQAAGRVREVGTATDVYALGAILYELLTARPPFKGDTAMDTIQQVLHRDPAPPRTMVPDVPRDLETVCLKCLEKEPGKRYPTADALAADLRAFLDGRPISARPVGMIERAWKWARRHPGRAAAVAAGVLLVAAAVVGVSQVRAQREADRRAADERMRQAERQTKADALVNSLVTADPAAVPALLTELGGARELVRPKLEQLAGEPIDTRGGFRGRLALIERGDNGSPRVQEVNEYMRRCRVDDLMILSQYAQSLEKDWHRLFWWAVFKEPDAQPDATLKLAAMFARLTPDDTRWADLAPHVAAPLVRVNPLEADVFARALEPVRGVLLPELLKRYPQSQRRIEAGNLPVSELVAEATAFDLTASLLARYTADRPAELAELAVLADARHHKLFAASLAANKAAVAPVLKAELARKPPHTWEPAPKNGDGVDVPLAFVVGAALERGTAIPDAVRAALAKRQANAAATLFALGETAPAWELLKFTPDPTVRSYLTARLGGIGADPPALIRRFAAEPEPSAKRAALLALGDYPPELIPAADRDGFVADLLEQYREHPDPGLHSAIDWVLKWRWGKAKEVAAIDAELTAAAVRRADPARGRLALPGVLGTAAVLPPPPAQPPPPGTAGWFVNGSGQTFAVIRGPVEFAQGSPGSELGRQDNNEVSMRKRIGRTYAISTKEVTTAEFRGRFYPEYWFLEQYSPDPDGPVVSVEWYDVARYCNWLNVQEGVPPDQWCYAPNANGKYAEGMTVKPGHLKLTGYRMPTEAEYEYACRSGTVTARHYGRGDELLGRYAWNVKNSDIRAWSVGRLRPNDFGLFDTLGNALDWCLDGWHQFTPPESDDGALDSYPPVVETDTVRVNGKPLLMRMTRVLKGGSFAVPTGFVRSGARTLFMPSHRNTSNGIRLARTMPE